MSLYSRVSSFLLQDFGTASCGGGRFSQELEEAKDEEMVRIEDLLCALKETRPSVSREELKKYQKM